MSDEIEIIQPDDDVEVQIAGEPFTRPKKFSYDLERYQMKPSGLIYDHQARRIVRSPLTTRITAKTTKDYAERRRLKIIKAQLAAANGMCKAVDTPDKFEAYAEIVRKQTLLAMDTLSGSASTRAAQFVREAIGFDGPEMLPQIDTAETAKSELALTLELAELLLRATGRL